MEGKKEKKGRMGWKRDGPAEKEYVFFDLYLLRDCLLSMPGVCLKSLF